MNTARFFEHYYNNARVNSILIIDSNGIILDVNKSFVKNFAYNPEELKGKHFENLFTPEDRKSGKPHRELQDVLTRGQANDENYVVDGKGQQVWCTGESILVETEDDRKIVVKDIVNLQAKKQLQMFLTATDELLERIFGSAGHMPMIILDGSMRIEKVNAAFLDFFELDNTPDTGSRLSDLDHPFWKRTDIRKEVSTILVTNEALKQKQFAFRTKSGEDKVVRVDSKIIERQVGEGRVVFILIEDITEEVHSNSGAKEAAN